jgi:hypothetical protein
MVSDKRIQVGAVKAVVGLADDILVRLLLRNAIIRHPF